MRLIILPGNSSHNKEWLEAASAAFYERFPRQHLQYYQHWQTEEQMTDMNKELDRLVKAGGSTEGDLILAKSVGTMLTLSGAYQGLLIPCSVVLLGLPIGFVKERGWDPTPWLQQFHQKATIIQKEYDPITSHQEVEEELEKLGRNNFELIKIPGNDHDYGEFSLISQYLY